MPGRTENFYTSWANRWLNPFGPEKKTINGLTFEAHRKKDRVWLIKECQELGLIHNHQKLTEEDKKVDILIMNNDEIEIVRKTYTTLYTFKAY